MIADSRLAEIISRIGPCPLGNESSHPFDSLVVSVIGQQLSIKAATTIQYRLQDYINTARPFLPEYFSCHSIESLKSTGLSAAKARCVLCLARAVETGEIDLGVLAYQPDTAVIETLTRLPGIGRWTAEMFLIFSLGRPDVLSITDTGLRRATRALYEVPDLDDQSFQELAEPWRPFRSAASWYLWRSLDEPSRRYK